MFDDEELTENQYVVDRVNSNGIGTWKERVTRLPELSGKRVKKASLIDSDSYGEAWFVIEFEDGTQLEVEFHAVECFDLMVTQTTGIEIVDPAFLK